MSCYDWHEHFLYWPMKLDGRWYWWTWVYRRVSWHDPMFFEFKPGD